MRHMMVGLVLVTMVCCGDESESGVILPVGDTQTQPDRTLELLLFAAAGAPDPFEDVGTLRVSITRDGVTGEDEWVPYDGVLPTSVSVPGSGTIQIQVEGWGTGYGPRSLARSALRRYFCSNTPK